MLSSTPAISISADIYQPSRPALDKKHEERPTVLNEQQQINEQDQKIVEKLQARDQEVKTHEQAHISAAGGLALGGASFTFATGPDGKRYAIGGEVSIDVSPVPNDPKATILKAETIRRAALAPLNPSSQDHSVAANASAMANKARVELAKIQEQTSTENSEQGKGEPQLDIEI
jgi:SprA family protein